MKRGSHDKLIKLVQESDKLLNDTLQGNGDAVAAAIDKVRSSNYAPTYYNDEQALRYVIKFAYIAAIGLLIFGANNDKGLILKNGKLAVAKIGEDGITLDDILTHHTDSDDIGLQIMLIDMKYPDMPVALGVIRDVQDKTYDINVQDQLEDVTAKARIHCVDDLLRSGSTWEVK